MSTGFIASPNLPVATQEEFSIRRHQRKQYEDCLQQMMMEGVCFYCGENAYDADTNIPSALFPAVFKVARKNGLVPDLPVCKSCKRIGGRKAFRTPQQKRAHIQRAMRRRDGKYLDVPDWDESEMAELGYSLKMMVKQGISRKRQLLRRLAWPRLRPKADKVSDRKA